MADMTEIHSTTDGGPNRMMTRVETSSDDTAPVLYGVAPKPLTLDQLDYLADLVAELRAMSGQAGLTTLAGILALAQVEASAQIAQARSRQAQV